MTATSVPRPAARVKRRSGPSQVHTGHMTASQLRHYGGDGASWSHQRSRAQQDRGPARTDSASRRWLANAMDDALTPAITATAVSARFALKRPGALPQRGSTSGVTVETVADFCLGR